MNINGKIKIRFKPAELEKYALGQIAFNINQNILQNRSKIRKEIKDFIRSSILEQSTAIGLQDNSNLAYNLGIPIGEGERRARHIANTVANSASITFPRVRRVGKQIVGGIKIGIILASYEDVLGLTAGIVRTDKGEELPWLKWLLKEGGKILIPKYYVRYVHNAENSRSTGAYMIEGRREGWAVSPEYQGLENDNWFTRAFEGVKQQEFLTLMDSIFIRYIDKTATVN